MLMLRESLAARRSPLALAVAPLLAAAFALAACQTVPGTNRKQLMFIPQSMEASLGFDAYQQAMAESKLITSGPDYEMVQRVGQRIGEAAKRVYPEPSSDFSFEIVLIDEPGTANAWCMPGGHMAVYSGLLPVTQDEAGLAVVVGHEVSHAVARHGSERMSQDLVFQLGLTAASASMSDMDPAQQDQIMQALVGVGTVGAILPFSRAQESEADELGLNLAADAGYDPQAAIGLWERMAAQSKGQAPIEFLSTHPSDASRIEHLKQVMPQAMDFYKQAQKHGR